MNRPNVPVPGPMPEEEMAKMMAVTRVDDDPVYPLVDDIAELKVGAIVFVTVTLNKLDNEETARFALPGIVYVGEEGKLAIRPLMTKLWEQGWEEVKSVPVNDDSYIRFCSLVEELDDDQLITDHYEDDMGEVIESCGEKLLKNAAFKQWLGGSIKSSTFKTTRWCFLRAVAERMATTLSITEWKTHRPPNFDSKNEVDKEQAKWFDTEFITPVCADKTSGMETEAEKTKYKSDVSPKATSTAKYLTMMMDILTSDGGPSPASKSKSGGHKAGADCSDDVKELTDQVKELKSTISTLTGTVNAIATQLKVRGSTGHSGDPEAKATEPEAKAAEPETKARIVSVPSFENECAYHVMSVAKAINDGTMPPTGEPTFTDEAVDTAKLALTVQARQVSDADPASFKQLLGFTIEELYTHVTTAVQDKKTWPGEYHLVLHATEHPDVELKIKTFREGKLATMSTRKQDLPPAKMVMFTHWRSSHFNIVGVQGAGPVKVAFTQAEAKAAEQAVDKLLTEAEQPMGKLTDEEFKSVVKAALVANRAGAERAQGRKPENTHKDKDTPPTTKSVKWAAGNAQAAITASQKSYERSREALRLKDQL